MRTVHIVGNLQLDVLASPVKQPAASRG